MNSLSKSSVYLTDLSYKLEASLMILNFRFSLSHELSYTLRHTDFTIQMSLLIDLFIFLFK